MHLRSHNDLSFTALQSLRVKEGREWIVKKIRRTRLVKRGGEEVREYLIAWQGNWADTWESEQELRNTAEGALADFWAAPGRLSRAKRARTS